ncbi:MAG: sugar isomerase domain-containing protein [candidate division WS1 bacterium]|nr:sugar isomerase domain-containing protein [candidate division WS1 bacterium]
MLQNDYLGQVRELIDRIETTQAETVDEVAEIVAEAIATRHGLFLSPLGHGNDGDLLHRAGGLALLQRLNFQFSVNATIAKVLQDRPQAETFAADLEAARVAVKASPLRAGDCLITGSVSGRTPRPVSLAMAAREIGVKVIAITSLEYTRQTLPAHSSGKLLYEVADYVLDSCVPVGDACMEVEGLPVKAFPVSGLATTMLCWMLCSQVVERLLARGLTPQIYMSANRPEGPEFNRAVDERYNQVGY